MNRENLGRKWRMRGRDLPGPKGPKLEVWEDRIYNINGVTRRDDIEGWMEERRRSRDYTSCESI